MKSIILGKLEILVGKNPVLVNCKSCEVLVMKNYIAPWESWKKLLGLAPDTGLPWE